MQRWSAGFISKTLRQKLQHNKQALFSLRFDWKTLKEDVRQCALPFLAVLVYLFVTTQIFGASCPSRILFHRYCPGCGLTRAALALLRFDVPLALTIQPAIFAWAAAALFFFCFRYLQPVWKGRQLVSMKRFSFWPFVLAACVSWMLFLMGFTPASV